ncbi:MAG: shikimate dehydrogenase [Spirochaetaceae bacterium]|nr:MAG: shikimate dehydrogenase [Spirochaetaceae bacterium]
MTLNFKQELTAVFGFPVAENPTQVMVEAAYRHHGLDWRYLTIEVPPRDLADAVAGARAMGFGGFNLTIPHKVSVMPLLDRIGESAEVIGAVNCVVAREGELVGENTDGRGFLESLRAVRDPAGLRVVLLGAGGAARAVAVELALAGAESITVVNRTAQRGEELAGHLRDKLGAKAAFQQWSDRIAVPSGTDLLVNATSIGLFPDVEACAPLDFDSLDRDVVVADVIPNPPLTPLLRKAGERGCRTIDGLGMLINQGRIGIRYWTGLDPDPAVMRAALEKVFNSTAAG